MSTVAVSEPREIVYAGMLPLAIPLAAGVLSAAGIIGAVTGAVHASCYAAESGTGFLAFREAEKAFIKNLKDTLTQTLNTSFELLKRESESAQLTDEFEQLENRKKDLIVQLEYFDENNAALKSRLCRMVENLNSAYVSLRSNIEKYRMKQNEIAALHRTASDYLALLEKNEITLDTEAEETEQLLLDTPKISREYEQKLRHCVFVLREKNALMQIQKGIEGISEKTYLLNTDASVSELLCDIQYCHNQIAKIDESEYIRTEELVKETEHAAKQRCEIIRNTLAFKLAELKHRQIQTEIFRQKLQEYESVKDKIRIPECAELLMTLPVISKEQYDSCVKKCNAEVQQALLDTLNRDFNTITANTIEHSLESLGYTVAQDAAKKAESLDSGEIVFFETRWQNYKVMIRLSDKHELSCRLVRILEPGQSQNEYILQQDEEVSRAWCVDFDHFMDDLKELGIQLFVTLRKEAGEEPVMCITGEDAKNSSEKFRERTVSL